MTIVTVAVVSPMAYGLSVSLAALGGTVLCVGARRRPGPWVIVAARGLGVVLAVDAVSFAISEAVRGDWSPSTSLPLALCNMAVLVAVAACWSRRPLLVELTWFWGMAGTVQAVATPDLDVGFPHLVFFQYVVGHLGIVLAALFMVVGMRITPRAGAVRRVFSITLAYTALVGFVDWLGGANYMFLRQPPANWTVLRLLGPWPWYIPGAAGVALVLIVVLDLPFRSRRRQAHPVEGQDHPVEGQDHRTPARSAPRVLRHRHQRAG